MPLHALQVRSPSSGFASFGFPQLTPLLLLCRPSDPSASAKINPAADDATVFHPKIDFAHTGRRVRSGVVTDCKTSAHLAYQLIAKCLVPTWCHGPAATVLVLNALAEFRLAHLLPVLRDTLQPLVAAVVAGAEARANAAKMRWLRRREVVAEWRARKRRREAEVAEVREAMAAMVDEEEAGFLENLAPLDQDLDPDPQLVFPTSSSPRKRVAPTPPAATPTPKRPKPATPNPIHGTPAAAAAAAAVSSSFTPGPPLTPDLCIPHHDPLAPTPRLRPPTPPRPRLRRDVTPPKRWESAWDEGGRGRLAMRVGEVAMSPFVAAGSSPGASGVVLLPDDDEEWGRPVVPASPVKGVSFATVSSFTSSEPAAPAAAVVAVTEEEEEEEEVVEDEEEMVGGGDGERDWIEEAEMEEDDEEEGMVSEDWVASVSGKSSLPAAAGEDDVATTSEDATPRGTPARVRGGMVGAEDDDVTTLGSESVVAATPSSQPVGRGVLVEEIIQSSPLGARGTPVWGRGGVVDEIGEMEGAEEGAEEEEMRGGAGGLARVVVGPMERTPRMGGADMTRTPRMGGVEEDDIGEVEDEEEEDLGGVATAPRSTWRPGLVSQVGRSQVRASGVRASGVRASQEFVQPRVRPTQQGPRTRAPSSPPDLSPRRTFFGEAAVVEATVEAAVDEDIDEVEEEEAREEAAGEEGEDGEDAYRVMLARSMGQRQSARVREGEGVQGADLQEEGGGVGVGVPAGGVGEGWGDPDAPEDDAWWEAYAAEDDEEYDEDFFRMLAEEHPDEDFIEDALLLQPQEPGITPRKRPNFGEPLPLPRVLENAVCECLGRLRVGSPWREREVLATFWRHGREADVVVVNVGMMWGRRGRAGGDQGRDKDRKGPPSWQSLREGFLVLLQEMMEPKPAVIVF
ncbi:hypothetical protein HDU96_006362 [Phlyctochytrium bullatum]|nr:hypothetical protein HDU96_006362 [Phlyctochytrium bullatum]